MKKTTLFFLVAIFTLTATFSFAQIPQKQTNTKKEAQQVDTRIDNMGYWIRCAEAGLVSVAPNIPPPKAKFKGSVINSKLVRDFNSVDVPVTEENSTQSENSIFVNPNDYDNALNSNNSTPNPVSGIYGTSGFYTFDFSETWEGSVNGTGGSNQGDPAACIGSNGYYYVGAIRNDGQAVAISEDEGETWSVSQVAPGPGGFNGLLDKNHLWIDNSSSSPFNGRLYDAWTYFGSGADDSEIQISLSMDNADTWSTAVTISTAINAGSHNQGVNIQTGPFGEVYVLWAIYDGWPADENAMGFCKSLDGGGTWTPAARIIQNIKGVRNTTTGKNQRMASFPSMAVDIGNGPRRGTIYAVWPNIGVPGTNQGPDVDIYMIKSINNGVTWSEPIRVNQDEPGNGYKHYMSWMTCDPISGAISVVYYDDRNVGGNEVEVFCANSTDGGETWDDFQVSDIAFTPAPIPGLAGGYMGDYLGISARGGNVYPCWTDNRTGVAMTWVSPYYLGLPPNPAAGPSPGNGEDDIIPFPTFLWQDGTGDGDSATIYKIYIGSDNPPGNIVNGEEVEIPSFPLPGSLNHNSLYYWKIDSYNDFGYTEGENWSFVTSDPPNEDFETGDFSHNEWYFEGNGDWIISDEYARSGIFSAKSGSINTDEYTSMKIDMEVVMFGSIKFSKKVSTVDTLNKLEFFANEFKLGEWSGEDGWTEESFIVSPGTYTFEWRYTKSVDAGSDEDATWIDYINFPPFPQLAVDAGSDGFTCEGNEFQLAGEAAYYESIMWTTGGDGIFSDPEQLDGMYISGPLDAENSSVNLTLTAYGTEGDSLSDFMTLGVVVAPKPYAGNNAAVCAGDDFSLLEATVAEANKWWWTTSGDGTFDDTLMLNPVYSPGVEDINERFVTLALHATGAFLCDEGMSDMELSIIDAPPVPEMPAGPDYVDLVYTTSSEFLIPSVSTAVSYEWMIDPEDAGTISGTDTTGIVEWNLSFLGIANIGVKAINACGESEFSEVKEVMVDNTVDYEENEDQTILKVVPNPNNGRFRVEINTGSIITTDLRIISTSGAVIYYEQIHIDQSFIKDIDLGHVKEGVYYLHLGEADDLLIRKIVITR